MRHRRNGPYFDTHGGQVLIGEKTLFLFGRPFNPRYILSLDLAGARINGSSPSSSTVYRRIGEKDQR